MSPYRAGSLRTSCCLTTAIFVAAMLLVSDLGWAAPPVRPIRPPVRVPVPESTPIRPPRDLVIPPRVGPSARSGAAPEETMRGPFSFRPVPIVPIVPFRAGPGERSGQDATAGPEKQSSGSPLWLLLLIVPVAGGLVLLLVAVLLIDALGKRRHGAVARAPAPADAGRSHINPRWSPSGSKQPSHIMSIGSTSTVHRRSSVV
jgi:hypothetical protein